MLKSLELFGFKSFADRTQFTFSHGITCVVGPNGSGKSNVVDAMKWILGDQSPKSLRGKEMSDVIFNGSTGRKSSAFAEATLTFDNTSRFLPLEFDEVSIGRRLWQNGDSEYLINGGSARLKDIRDAFMGTGAATSAYSIIEQGRVDQILNSNAVARRMVFEEAAGISRFKSRKNDALRKLERVSQNLLRLQDIVDQLESQLNATRNQAQKAAKYREVSTELEKLWLGLAADDGRWFTAQLKKVETELAETTLEHDALTKQQNGIESRLSTFDGEIAEVDDRLRESEQVAGATREAIVSQEATIRHETSRLRETESELVRMRRQHVSTLARINEVVEQLASGQTESQQFDATFVTQQQTVKSHEERLDELARASEAGRHTIELQRKQRSQLAAQAAELRQQIAIVEARARSLAESREQNIELRAELEHNIESSRVSAEDGQARVEQVLSEVAELSEASQMLRSRLDELKQERESKRQKLVEMREQRSASQARLAVLEDLEQRQEGLALGVREILNRARTSDSPPWNGILGSVADLLDVDLENAALVEVALGARAQLIVMEDAAPLIEYLGTSSSRIDGRVGFLGLNTETTHSSTDTTRSHALRGNAPSDAPRPGTQSVLHDVPTQSVETSESQSAGTSDSIIHDLSGDPDVIQRADALISSSCEHRHLAELLLDSTWVVMDLTSARRLSASDETGQRFVTLQGELLEPDGTLYTGSVRGESAVVSRKSELRRLKNDLVRLDQLVGTSEQQFEALVAQIQAASDELADVVSNRDGVNEQLAQARAEFATSHRRLQQLTEQQATTESELAENETLIEAAQTELAEHFEQLNQVELAEQQADSETARLESELIEFEHERNRLIQAQTEDRLRLARQTERRESLQAESQRLQEEQTGQQEQLEEITRRIDALDQRRRASVLVVLNTNSELASLAIQAEQSTAIVREQSQEKRRLRDVRGQLVEEDNRIRQERREVADRQHEQELQVRDMRHRLSTSGERIEEEFNRSLEDVVASDASAFREFLIERGLLSNPDDEVVEPEPDTGPESEIESDNVESDTNVEAEHAEDHDDAEEDDADEAIDTAATEPDVSSLTPEELVHTEVGGTRFEDVRDELEERVNRLRRKLKSIGNVNTESLEHLDELESRFEHFNSQFQDLTEAKATLEDIIRRINAESRRMFTESFETIRGEFRELFRRLFGGGDGDIILEDPDDVLECGIEIVARPPGKELRSISLLSGGEKTMTAAALLLSIFRSRPSPFCILDEVDAALDDANVERYATMIHEFRDTTQFIMISHRKRTMTVADVIYGVTMEQSGVSKRLTVSFEDVGEDGEIRTTGSSESAQAA